jgi:toxin ParE1/3/4
MRRYRFTDAAKRDMRQIGAYIRKDSRRAARQVVNELRRICRETLVLFPDVGTMRDDLSPGLRCFSVGNYVIYFRDRDPVYIVRIVHGARDERQLDFGG